MYAYMYVCTVYTGVRLKPSSLRESLSVWKPAIRSLVIRLKVPTHDQTCSPAQVIST